jgi:hypothetical protein
MHLSYFCEFLIRGQPKAIEEAMRMRRTFSSMTQARKQGGIRTAPPIDANQSGALRVVPFVSIDMVFVHSMTAMGAF